MENTRKPLIPGRITEERMNELKLGMVLRLHVPNDDGKHWDWFDVQYDSHTPKVLRIFDRLNDPRPMSYCLSAVGVIPNRSGKYSAAYICIRDEELGLRKVA